MSLEDNEVVSGMEQADADANLQKAISRIHPFLVNLILSNPITTKKMRNKKPDFSQSLQAIIEDWSMLYPTKSQFYHSKKHFSRAKKVRNLVAHQSFDRNRYQHYMECLAQVAKAIGKPDLSEFILKQVVIKSDDKEENNKAYVANVKEVEWASLKQDGNQFYKQERWREAMNCYTRAIHLNQGEAVLYSNRALCELHLSKFDLAREDIEDAIQLDPKNVKYFRILSDVLLKMKMHEESLSVCLQGLEIDPRDNVLVLRERDCRALIASDETDKNPNYGKSILDASTPERYEKLYQMIKSCEKLHLTSEDIDDCPNSDRFTGKRSKLSKSIEKAHHYAHGKLSAELGSERKAFDIYEAVAEKGSADGLYNMALFYSEGKAGLTRDFQKAIELCRKAASQKAFYRFNKILLPNVGVAEAEGFLGNCYRDGRGVDQCYTEAFKWYLKSSRHGCPHAQNNLGHALLNGEGCKMDEVSARSWFQKAAEQGLAEAQSNYAMVLQDGRGGPVDIFKAGELLQLSANQGSALALWRLQKLSLSGALGASIMEQTKENLKKEAGKGDPASLFLLGQNYLSGSGGFEKDLSQAERLLREASKAGYTDAHLPLGKLLLELKKNEDAFEFIKLSAEKGSSEGQFQLGMLYAYGHGCARDGAKSKRWFNRAKMQRIELKLNPEEEETFTDYWIKKEIDYGKDLSEFETHQLLKTEGMTIKERQRRFLTSRPKLDASNPAAAASLSKYLEAFPPDGRPPRTPYLRSKVITYEYIIKLVSRAENGSVTAQSFFRACEILEHATDLLNRQQTNDAFNLYRLSLREWDLQIVLFSNFYSKCVEAAKQALDRNTEDADALYVLARQGKTQSNEEKLQMFKRCVELDPSVPDFHHMFGSMLGFVEDSKNGLRAVERAIEMLPNHPDWLYTRATLMRLAEDEKGLKDKKYSDDVSEAYLKFESSNPKDHRKFPEACYCLAMIYVLSDEKTKAETYYQKAIEAEDPKIRLQYFEPVEHDFPPKIITRMFLDDWEGLKKTGVFAAQEKVTNHCASCLKSNELSRCTACKSVWYCDRACQVSHWKKHKQDCKRLSAQK